MTPQYTRDLVAFLSDLKPADLPAQVVDRARYFLLDYLAVAVRGSCEPSAEAVQRMVAQLGAKGCATLIGTDMQAAPGAAALANGTAAHSIEQDDTHSGGSIHLGAVMYAAALPLAETQPEIPADRFLTAVVAGYEAAARIAMALQPKEHYELGFHPTATCGVFGATVTAAKLLGLSGAQTLAAFGIAGSMAAGSMEYLADGAWTKRLHPGLAAQNGIHAALLASEGFSGPASILEGRDGFLHGHSQKPLPEKLTAGLGRSFEILQTSVKPHGCCRYMQGPVDAILELMREHRFAASQIRKIKVAVLEAGWAIVAEPQERKYHPESIVDAQFSMPFGAAVAALEGAAGLDQFTLDHLSSPAIRAMMDRVVMVKDPTIESTFPREWPARVWIELEDGRQVEKLVRFPKGDPQNPVTWNEMADKFRALASPVLSSERCAKIVEQVAIAHPASLPPLCAREVVCGTDRLW